MSITVELPGPLGEELAEVAEKAGMSAQEHATILLCVVTALLHRGHGTPFEEEVRRVVASSSLDADRVAAALEEVVALCAAAGTTRDGDPDPSRTFRALREWRDGTVHRAEPPAGAPRLDAGRPSAMGRYAHVPGTSGDFAREKRREIELEERKRA